MIRGIQDSAPMVAQRQRLRAAFGPAHVPDDAPAQRAQGEGAIRNVELLDDEEGNYVLAELEPRGRLPHAADVADALERHGLLEKRTRDSEPMELDDFRDAVQDALDHGAGSRARSSEALLPGLKKGHVQVRDPGDEQAVQVIMGPFPPGTIEDGGELSAEDLFFSDNAAASGDHSLITDTRAAEGDGIWQPR